MSTKTVSPALAPSPARTPLQDMDVLDGLLAGIATADEESHAGIDHEYREQDDEADSYTGSAREWADRRGELYDLWRREI